MSTVRIALDKVSYEIDLTADNEARLRDKLAKLADTRHRWLRLGGRACGRV